MRNKVFFCSALIVLLVVGCKSLTPACKDNLFKKGDPTAVKDQQLKLIPAADLARVQFFSGNGKITLSRVILSKEKEITNGQIFDKDGQKIEQIVIPKFTKGILFAADSTSSPVKLKVLFEDSSAVDGLRYLTFKMNTQNLFELSTFTKAGDKDKRNYVTYGKFIYDITFEGSDADLLFVDQKQIKSLTIETKKVSGMSVGGSDQGSYRRH